MMLPGGHCSISIHKVDRSDRGSHHGNDLALWRAAVRGASAIAAEPKRDGKIWPVTHNRAWMTHAYCLPVRLAGCAPERQLAVGQDETGDAEAIDSRD